MSVQAEFHSDKFSHDAYFAIEASMDQRFEYLAGQVFAMAGGSESHALIAMNLGAALVNSLRLRPCRVYGADMKLHIAAFDKFCYPDVQVICHEGRRLGSYVEAPTLVVEVLSPSTESYDRGRKFEHYRAIPELHHYLLLAQDRAYAELFTRAADGAWLLTEVSGLDAQIYFTIWEFSLPLIEIYRNVDFAASECIRVQWVSN